MNSTEERYRNTYHNASTAALTDVPKELAGYFVVVDPILGHAAELARVVTHAHQGAATQLIGGDWAHARKYFSLSEKYAQWADYRTPAVGLGIHGYAHRITRVMRFTDEELRAHPDWRGFSREAAEHPPMRGWLVAPLLGSDGVNYGFIQASDRIDGDFNDQDEENLARLAALTSTALDALAEIHIPAYRRLVHAS